MRLFLSYARTDKRRVRRLRQILWDAGFEPWMDLALVPAEHWRKRILDEITRCDVFVYILTPASIDSRWCRWEFAQAARQGKPILPVLLRQLCRDQALPLPLANIQWAELTGRLATAPLVRLTHGIQLAEPIPEEWLGQVEDVEPEVQDTPAQAQWISHAVARLPLWQLPQSIRRRALVIGAVITGVVIGASILGGGNWTEWSEVRRYGMTLHTWPENASITTDRTPTFKWKKTSGALAVQFRLDDDYNLDGDPLLPAVPLAGSATQYTVSELPVGTYYWQMRVQYSDTRWSAWMPAWSVIVVPPTPAAPKLDEPAHNETVTTSTPTFGWQRVAYGETYRIQIDDNTNFSSPVYDEGLDENALMFSSDPLADGTYYWRVRAVNSVGVEGAWSGYHKVIVDAP